MIDIESKTYKNLHSALKTDCLKFAKYSICAQNAYEDDFIKAGDEFLRLAENKYNHIKIWFKLLYGWDFTQTDLSLVEYGEESTQVDYTEFASTAIKEGFCEEGRLFKEIRKIESEHSKKINALRVEAENGEWFSANSKCEWICSYCGHRVKDIFAPDECCVCKHKYCFLKDE